ncbi:MAG: hypothetical protein V1712_01035 [Patescibacteria group bacterium]
MEINIYRDQIKQLSFIENYPEAPAYYTLYKELTGDEFNEKEDVFIADLLKNLFPFPRYREIKWEIISTSNSSVTTIIKLTEVAVVEITSY